LKSEKGFGMRFKKPAVWLSIFFYLGFVHPPTALGTIDTVLYSFGTATNDGTFPTSYDSLVSDGTYLYGMTSQGGVAGHGTVFRITIADHTYGILHSFGQTTVLDVNGNIVQDGMAPNGSLLISGAFLFGMTHVGGAGGNGTVFRMPINGGPPTILHSFGDGTTLNDGLNPDGSLILSGDNLYGMTPLGGSDGAGVIFRITTGSGLINIMHSFGDGSVRNDGQGPSGSLVLSGDGTTLYGMTEAGGSAGFGTVFSTPPSGGAPAILRSFGDGSVPNDGNSPTGSLILSSDNNILYGMTLSGGAHSQGTVFTINHMGGNGKTLHSFGDSAVPSDGAAPFGNLVLSGQTLLGMTDDGGAAQKGVIFQINTDGTGYATLHSFSDGTVHNDGAHPQGTLFLQDGVVYGLTYQGGQNSEGTIFSMQLAPVQVPGAPTGVRATAGDMQAIVSFTPPASNGGSPITGYTVTSIPPGGVDSFAGTTLTTHTVTNLANGTAYEFTVTATNAGGTGPPSQPSKKVTTWNVPGAPKITTVKAGNAQASVGFAPPASNGGAPITGYAVTSHPAGGVDTNAGSLSSPHDVNNLVNGTPYMFTVTATNAVGSNVSAASKPTIPATVPGPPTGVTATAGNAEAIVSFTAPTSDGGFPITGYTVTSNPRGGKDAEAGKTTTEHTVKGLTNGHSYTFTVTATNKAGTGAASGASNSVTPVK
jgi:uncharacterized repeat protein (TIGR03803 family)